MTACPKFVQMTDYLGENVLSVIKESLTTNHLTVQKILFHDIYLALQLVATTYTLVSVIFNP